MTSIVCVALRVPPPKALSDTHHVHVPAVSSELVAPFQELPEPDMLFDPPEPVESRQCRNSPEESPPVVVALTCAEP